MLLSCVHQIENCAWFIFAEIHHHISPLSHGEGELFHRQWFTVQPGIVADPQMLLHCAGFILNAELIDATGGCAKHAQTGLGGLHHKERV